MGNLGGHVLPGSFFLLFSLWSLVRTLQSYYFTPGSYVSKITRSCCCKKQCCSRVPYDMWILVFVAGFGGVLEVVTSFKNVGVLIMGNEQHLTMYAGFVLAGIISILTHHEFKFLPKWTDYTAMLIALIVELILFRFHLHGREVVDEHMHMLLVYSVAGCIGGVGLEILYPHSVTVSIARHFMMIVQGTWFFQLGFTLYPPDKVPKVDMADEKNIMYVTLLYCWHLIGCFVGMLVMAALIYYCTTGRCQASYSRQQEMALLSNRDETNNGGYLLDRDKEDDDLA